MHPSAVGVAIPPTRTGKTGRNGYEKVRIAQHMQKAPNSPLLCEKLGVFTVLATIDWYKKRQPLGRLS